MRTNNIVKTLVLFSLIGSISLVVWWFLMPILLPVVDAAENFQNMIMDKDWVPVNLIGLIAVIFIILGFPGFCLSQQKKFNRLGFTGLLIATTGLILFACIQYYETIIWPAAASINPELVMTNGELVSGDTGVVAGLIASGILLGAGYILFGISALQTKVFPKVPVWFLIVGTPIFGNGILFPIRTAGLILFSVGIIWLALHTRKNMIKYPDIQ